jgi:activator of Hsp90 ATPase-like protein
VVFDLEEVPEGTRLRVVESGFEGIAADRLQKAFRGNEQGWTEQLENLHRHVHPAA